MQTVFWQEAAVLRVATIPVKLKPLPTELIDERLAEYKKSENLIGQNGLSKQLVKALVKHAIQGEKTDHPGHGKNQLVTNEVGNTRNGRSKTTVSQKWTMPIRDWKAALNRFTIQFDERMPSV